MLALRIAFRYIFSKKSTNAINIISRISMLGMGVGAFSLILVLSVFNGFEHLVLSLYSSFYADLEIRAVRGKTFDDDSLLKNKILHLPGIASLSRTLEENAYLEYGDETQLATIKGVDEKYNSVTTVNRYVRDGHFLLSDQGHPMAVVGANISYGMNIDVHRGLESLRITVPRNNLRSINPENSFNTQSVIPSGIFAIQQEFDSRYIFLSLTFAQQLLGYEKRLSAYEIKLDPKADPEEIKTHLQTLVGNTFKVRTRYEQKAETYQVMLIERWVTAAILGFIILIISFNIIGSLSMLVLEKQKDISILKALGTSNFLIQRVYLLNGLLSSLIGALTGLALGYLLIVLQLNFHFLKLGGSESSFVINYYPVVMRRADPFIILGIIISVSLLASWFPARRASVSAMSFK